jgi:hypothetical protein
VRDAYGSLIDEYPPLTYIALGLASYGSRLLGLTAFHAFKLMILISEYASTVVVWMWRPRLVVVFTALWVIYGMLYGYLDVVFARPYWSRSGVSSASARDLPGPLRRLPASLRPGSAPLASLS